MREGGRGGREGGRGGREGGIGRECGNRKHKENEKDQALI